MHLLLLRLPWLHQLQCKQLLLHLLPLQQSRKLSLLMLLHQVQKRRLLQRNLRLQMLWQLLRPQQVIQLLRLRLLHKLVQLLQLRLQVLTKPVQMQLLLLPLRLPPNSITFCAVPVSKRWASSCLGVSVTVTSPPGLVVSAQPAAEAPSRQRGG